MLTARYPEQNPESPSWNSIYRSAIFPGTTTLLVCEESPETASQRCIWLYRRGMGELYVSEVSCSDNSGASDGSLDSRGLIDSSPDSGRT